MALRTTYANLADGLQPFSLWDASLSDMGNLGVTPCTAAGTNSIVLTPISTVFAPTVAAPQALKLFSFVAVASSSGAVTVQVGTTAALKLYRMDGVTQASTGDIVNTVLYFIGYNAALNSAAGGFQILAPISNEINPIISGATITNSTYNGNTWTAGTGTLTIAAGKTETFNNTLTFSGTDGTAMLFPTTSATIARTDTGQTFTGTNAFGVLTATTLNGNTFTAGTYTLTGTAAKTLNFTNSLTLSGTDATTITFQGTDTYVGKATTDILTNKTYDTAGAGNVFKINGNTISSNTGTGAVNVLSASPTITTPVLSGITTGASASAGNVGEVIAQTILVGSAVGLTTGTPANIATITLTAGAWEISAQPAFTGGATTTVTGLRSSISTTTATENVVNPNFSSSSYSGSFTAFATFDVSNAVAPIRVNLSGNQQYWLVSRANFATSTCSGYGTLRATRVQS